MCDDASAGLFGALILEEDDLSAFSRSSNLGSGRFARGISCYQVGVFPQRHVLLIFESILLRAGGGTVTSVFMVGWLLETPPLKWMGDSLTADFVAALFSMPKRGRGSIAPEVSGEYCAHCSLRVDQLIASWNVLLFDGTPPCPSSNRGATTRSPEVFGSRSH